VLEGCSDLKWISDGDELYAMIGYVLPLEVVRYHGGLANRLF
jgi:hypothetical protein